MNGRAQERRKREFHYRQLADDIEAKICCGSFKAGEKLPSLRNLHARTGLSISTVYQAYMELESRGMVEARRKSGYYVRPRLRDILPPPAIKRISPRPQKVEVNVLAESISEAIRDPAMIPFGAAVPAMELLPLKQLASSMRSVMARYLKKKEVNYGYPTGVTELKRQIVKRALGYNEHVDEEEVVITNGCMDAIHLCLRAVTGPGDAVLVESPTFSCYLQLIEDLNLLALEMPTDPGQGLDLAAVEEALDEHRVKACIVCANFQNPLGFEMDVSAKKELVDLLTSRNIPIIEDDIYGDLSFGSGRPRTLKSLDTSGLVLYCSSFSKTLAPDLRVGWALPGRFLKQVKRIKFNTLIASSKLNQFIIADFLATTAFDRHLRRLTTLLRNQAMDMAGAIGMYFPPGTKMSSPRGGYVIWVELPEGVDGLDLFHEARKRKIFVLPGEVCTSTENYRNCIRMSFGHPWDERLREAVRTLGELVDRMRNSRK